MRHTAEINSEVSRDAYLGTEISVFFGAEMRCVGGLDENPPADPKALLKDGPWSETFSLHYDICQFVKVSQFALYSGPLKGTLAIKACLLIREISQP